MPATLRPTRQEVSDRFPMLGFNIRNDGSARRAEIALTTEPALLSAENKGQRTLANFYSSRAVGSLNLAAGETMYIVPPEVLSRFVGQDKLYFALATSGDSGPMKVDVKPNPNSPYVSIRSLSSRSMSRVRVLPNRQQRAAGYNGAGLTALEWAGDVATPGMTAVPPNLAYSGDRGPNGGAPNTGAAPAAHDHYDDGFGPMPASPAASAPAAAAPAAGVPAAGSPAPASTAAPQAGAPAASARPVPAAQGLDAGGDDDRGIDGPLMVDDDGTLLSAAQAWTLSISPEYGSASRFAPSPAFRAVSTPRTINRIVIHVTDAPTTSSTVNAFTAAGAQTSAHYLVGQDGEVIQFVKENDVAWHAHSANSDSIGIEHVAIKRGGVTYTRRDGTPVTYPAMPPSDAQYCASAALVVYLCDKYHIPADRVHILGHAEADPRTTHTSCPNGADWDWTHYMDLVNTRSCHARTATSTGQSYASAQGYGGALGGSTRNQRPHDACNHAAHALAEDSDDEHGIDGPLMADEDGTLLSAAQAWALQAPSPEYSGASRFAPATAFRAVSGVRTINRIVIHVTDAPTTSSTVNTFTNAAARVSAHYLVGQDGEVIQFVKENDVAWHASNANGDSIGIEHVAIKRGGVTYTRRDGTPITYPAMPPSDAQYCASAALVVYLCDKYHIPADRVHILGHAEVDTHTTHTSCPDGAGWNWAHYMQLITNRNCAPQPASMGLGTDAPPRVTGQDGIVRWDLWQYPDMKAPAGQTVGSNRTPAGTIQLNDWPYLDEANGARTQLGIKIIWAIDGAGSVGAVQILPAEPLRKDGRKLAVEVTFADAAGSASMAAIDVVIRYVFSHETEGDQVAVTRITLNGNGRFVRASDWQAQTQPQTQAPAGSNANRRGGGAAQAPAQAGQAQGLSAATYARAMDAGKWDRIASSVFGAASYDEFVRTLQSTPFLNQTVNQVHADLVTCLQAADASLQAQGITRCPAVNSTLRQRHSMHGLGMAIDFDAMRNPYVLNEAGEADLDRELLGAYDHIANFVLGQASSSLRNLARGRSAFGGAIGGVYDALRAESDAMKQYFQMMNDANALLAFLGSQWQVVHPGATSPEVAVIQEQMANDYEILGGAMNAGHKRPTGQSGVDRPFAPSSSGGRGDPATGFLNMDRELVLALTDAGLAWGAVDFGPASGDVMHFDCRLTALGRRAYAALRAG